MSKNEITYDGATYDGELALNSGGLLMSHAMVGESLAIDSLTATIRTQDLPARLLASDQGPNDFIFTADGKILCVREGAKTPAFKENEPALYYFDDDLVGKYYLQKQHQLNEYEHEQTYYSGVHLLGKKSIMAGCITGKPWRP
jgi:hypothetical protein